MIGIVVTYQTKELFEAAYKSLRQFHPFLPLIIVDGSPAGSPCFEYVKSLRNQINTVYQLEKNIGHGLGLHYGIERTKDERILIFDSDIVMTESPVRKMAELLEAGVYAVGEQYMIGRDGLHRNPVRDVPYIRPYFMLLSRTEYYNHHRFIHHGSPCIKPMLEIFDAGQSAEKLRHLDLTPYIQHLWAGTRNVNRSEGKHEIPNTWEL